MPSLKKLTRDTLNEKAANLGVADAEQLPNRAAVIAAIEAAKEREHAGIWGQGARVMSVFGKGKYRRVLVEMSPQLAQEQFGAMPLWQAGPTTAVDATESELARIRKRKAEVADSALAAAALRMAFEIDHPYNSATAKANCVNELHKIMDRLLELAPAGEEQKGALDELKARRAKRKAAA